MPSKKILINVLIISALIFLALASNKQLHKYIGLGSSQHDAIAKGLSGDGKEFVPAEVPATESHTTPPPAPTITEVTKESHSENYDFFKLVGQSFYIFPDNEYLLKKWGFKSSMFSLKTFLPAPDKSACRDDYCNRKAIFQKSKFTLEAIVQPVGGDSIKENKKDEPYTCRMKIYNCFYKAKFDDGEVGYMLVADFDDAYQPLLHVATNTPSRLQIHPVAPDKAWRKSKRFFDNHFKKLSVLEGFTRDEVLRSGWGEPYSKTRSTIGDISVEIWSFNNGMITFQDGYVSQITEVSY